MMAEYILGISAFYHDSAICLLRDGKIVFAAQEERFSRIKHDPGFPKNAINYCLRKENIKLRDIEYITFYDKPFLKFERILETYLAFAPNGISSFSKSMPIWVKEKLFQKNQIISELNSLSDETIDFNKKLLFTEHHLSHAGSAFYPAPFQNAAILTMDGVGEWATTSLAIGAENKINLKKELHFPHSLGLLYSAFTYFAGFKVNSGEYKLMGLAPYGNPKYINKIKDNLIDIKSDGTFRLDMSYFDYCTGLTMTNNKFHKLFNSQPRLPETDISQKEMDIAASIQSVTEEVVIKLAKSIANETGQENLCLAGGVALNCVVNGILQKKEIFKNLWIQPAAGDAGGALGAALLTHFMHLKNSRSKDKVTDSMKGTYLGPEYSDNEIESSLINKKAIYKKLDEEELVNKVARDISNGLAVGWMQGKMEFGPRALGNRSILGDPRSVIMQKNLNLKVKYRESFRPFAPSILSDDLSEWFSTDEASPYMMLVSEVNSKKIIKMSEEEEKLFGTDKLNIKRSEIPAVTHVDYSARIQTVHKETNPKYYSLLKSLKEITGCPIVVNTSFNIRGEPIVCSPDDAFQCFMGTELDILVINNYYLKKEDQDKNNIKEYKFNYKLD